MLMGEYEDTRRHQLINKTLPIGLSHTFTKACPQTKLGSLSVGEVKGNFQLQL